MIGPGLTVGKFPLIPEKTLDKSIMTCSLLITEAEIDRQTENKNSHLFVQFLNANNVQVRVGNKAGSWERNPLLSHGCLGHSQMSHELPCARVHTD